MPRAAERAEGKGAAAVLADRRQPLRSRVARIHATHSYRGVLVLIVCGFIFASIASDEAWTTGVLLLLEAVTLCAAVWSSGLTSMASKPLIALLTASVVSAVGVSIHDRPVLTAVAGIAAAVLAVGTVVAVAIGVVDQDEVNAQSVTGAVCIYLLFGMIFLFLYTAVALIGSGPFFVQGTDGSRALRLYFSYVTLATLGYGDYTPAGDLGHTLAILEALLGQLYLVTVLALLVSRLRSRHEDDRR